ncbi:MAG: FecR domain-containing protein [Myxococcota bacterium]
MKEATDLQPLRRHMEPELPDREVDERWRELDARVRAKPAVPRPRRRVLAASVGGGLALAAAAVATVVLTSTEGRELAEGVTFSSEGGGEATLADGSRIELGEDSVVHARAVEAEQIVVELLEGRSAFEVMPSSREFHVVIGTVRVTVLGTRFTTTQHGDEVTVSVAHGRVRVSRHGQTVATLHRGESWTGPFAASVERASDEVAEEEAPSATGGVELEEARPSSQTSEPHNPEPHAISGESGHRQESRHPRESRGRQPGRGSEPLRERDPRSPSDRRARETGETPSTSAEGNIEPEAPTDVSAMALFREAQTARRGGNPTHAAELLSQLLERFPGSGVSGTAAMELGRIRMDVQGNLRGAARAFERALAIGGGAYLEDALARLAIAYGRLGDSRCARVRDRYLAAYSGGVHRDEVAAVCGGER